MTNEWDNQGQGGAGGADGRQGPQFDQGPHGQAQPPGSYGQQQHQDPYGPQYPHNPYGQQHQPYGQPQDPYTQPGAPYQPGYGNPYAHAAPEDRSSVLGIIGMGLVVAATLILAFLAWTFGKSFGEFVLEVASGSYMTEEEVLNDPRTQQWLQSAMGNIAGMLAISVAGLTGWIVSIVATVQRRGRVFGIVGIILGVLALGLAYGTFMAGWLPVMEQLNI